MENNPYFDRPATAQSSQSQHDGFYSPRLYSSSSISNLPQLPAIGSSNSGFSQLTGSATNLVVPISPLLHGTSPLSTTGQHLQELLPVPLPYKSFTPPSEPQPVQLPPSRIPSIVPLTLAADGALRDAPVPILQNVVSTVNLDVQLNLREIALQVLNAEYNPNRFSALIMRIRQPRTTALIFNNGKIVCTGAKSEEQSRIAARKFARILQKLGYDVHFGEFKVQNMVGSCDVGFKICLIALQLTHDQFTTYEPELFPGLVYRMIKPSVVLLVFKSGKLIITGARNKQDIDLGFQQIYPILRSFKY